MIAPQDREEEVVVRLARIGFDRVAGYLREPEGAFLDAPERRPPGQPADRPGAGDGPAAARRPPFVVDVRNPGEVRLGTIPGRRARPARPAARAAGRDPAGPAGRRVLRRRLPLQRRGLPAAPRTASTTCPTSWAATAPGCRSPSPSAEWELGRLRGGRARWCTGDVTGGSSTRHTFCVCLLAMDQLSVDDRRCRRAPAARLTVPRSGRCRTRLPTRRAPGNVDECDPHRYARRPSGSGPAPPPALQDRRRGPCGPRSVRPLLT